MSGLQETGITVITLTRERPAMLRRAIASVQAQDYPGPVQHLVIADDDPGSIETAHDAPARPGRTVTPRLVKRPPDERGPEAASRGSAYARMARLLNVGIREALHPWVAFLDDDNEHEPDHLSSLIACAAEHGSPAVHSARQMVWPDGSPYLEPSFPGSPDPAEGARIYRLMCDRGLWIEGTNVLLDRVDPGEHTFRNSTVLTADDPIFLVDQNLWLIQTGLLRRIPVPESFTAQEIADNTCPDDKLLEALVRDGVPIKSSGRPTVRYYLGGISNGAEQGDDPRRQREPGQPAAGLAKNPPKAQSWKVPADVQRSYELRMVEPLLAPSQTALGELGNLPGRRVVVLDDGAAAFWEAPLRECLAGIGIEAEIVLVPGGEAAKSLDVAKGMLERFHQFGVDRRAEPILIVGGGAVLDVGGFAASIYRRGVPYIRVPTTLLAYVDASVGVKTGVNFCQGKNLVGNFAPPVQVLLDRRFLTTVSPEEIASGAGELIKLAVGCDAALFVALEELAAAGSPDFAAGEREQAILHRTIETTLGELSWNLYEAELCRALDLGHTFSQAFEMADGADGMRHGEAVFLDVCLSALLAVRRNLLPAADAGRIARVGAQLGLPGRIPGVGLDQLWASLQERSQHRGGQQRTPLPAGLGRCVFVDDLNRAELAAAYERLPGRLAAGQNGRTWPPAAAMPLIECVSGRE